MAVGENCRHRFSRAFTLGVQSHASRVHQERNRIVGASVANRGQRATTRSCAGKNSVGTRPKDLGVNGGRYRIRTYDFHRVKMALYR